MSQSLRNLLVSLRDVKVPSDGAREQTSREIGRNKNTKSFGIAWQESETE
jgi:hypothetical protein